MIVKKADLPIQFKNPKFEANIKIEYIEPVHKFLET